MIKTEDTEETFYIQVPRNSINIKQVTMTCYWNIYTS